MIVGLLSSVFGLLLYTYYPPGWSDDVLVTIDTANTQGRGDIGIDSTNASWLVWVDSATISTGEAG